MSGEQWAYEACIPGGGGGGGVWGGGSGGPPQKFFEKVSTLHEIDSGGIWQPSSNHSCDSTCTCKLPIKSGTCDCGYI